MNLSITTTSQTLKQLLEGVSVNNKNLLEILKARNCGESELAVVIQNNGTTDIWMNSFGDAVVNQGYKIAAGSSLAFGDQGAFDISFVSDGATNSLVGIAIA